MIFVVSLVKVMSVLIVETGKKAKIFSRSNISTEIEKKSSLEDSKYGKS